MTETQPSAPPPPPPQRRAIPVLYQGHARVTWALLAFIGLMFGLETLLGGSEIGPVLTRLGANLPAETLQGDYWRLVSSVFLHIGWIHLFANGMVLALLGPFFEKLVGSQRYFLLFFLCGVTGSWASATFSGAELSAGASGALWGLLGASLGLSLFPGPVFPTPWVKSFRKNTIINLAINLYLSTLANIDFAAHLGGGLMGLLLFASGLLTRGLPVQPQHPVPRIMKQWLFQLVSLFVFISLVALSIPLFQQKPQELLGPPDLSQKSLPLSFPEGKEKFRLVLDAPTFLSVSQQDNPMPQAQRYTLGDIKTDPAMIIVSWLPFSDTLGDTASQREAAQQVQAERAKQKLPATAQITEDFTWLKNVLFPSWRRQIAWSNGLQQTNLSQTQPNALVDIQIIYYDVFSEDYQSLGETILRSLDLKPMDRSP
ncbi:MAG: hypothetical protein CMH56_02490 [Myxococcales bacterium]|nr:hypothetical protein [Myxococcales bacterium]|tara:strand:+ start:2267 stop:3550 length:1284 start_codon:yes stop_codon:yes gene_type:complete